jgi:hypothetical protein
VSKAGTAAILALGCLALLAAGDDPGQTTPALRFPRMELTLIDGSRTVLPDSMSGQVFWAAFAFRRQDQSIVDTWVPLLDEATQQDSTCRFYEIPLMGPRIPGFLRGIIRAGMRAGIPADKHSCLAPYYGDVDTIAAWLGMDNRETVHLFLVRKDGFVAHRAEGKATEKSVSEMLDTARLLVSNAPDDGR